MQAMVYPPVMQGRGEFDGGKIKEQKPIGFPGEGSVVKRVGPLFYWAWAKSSADAEIGLHPHQGFEIMTYVVEGTAHHRDTLGTDSSISAGGAQIMQTGSGVSHQERISANAELFQIWFEPQLTEATRRPPTYHQFEHEDFPQESSASGSGYSSKTVVGPGSPVELVSDIEMWDVEVNTGARYIQQVPAGYSITALVIRGQGAWTSSEAPRESVPIGHRDFIVAAAEADTAITILNTSDTTDTLRLILIKVPTTVSYPLYRKR